jgi:hypothetical protein
VISCQSEGTNAMKLQEESRHSFHYRTMIYLKGCSGPNVNHVDFLHDLQSEFMLCTFT